MHAEWLAGLQLKPLPMRQSLDATPTLEDMLAAISQLKGGKHMDLTVSNRSLFNTCRSLMCDSCIQFVCRIWNGLEPMPVDWKANFLVPLPKTGDLAKCARWRGILLSSVPSILNGRLQAYCEDVGLLRDRAGRGTSDMLFTLRVAMDVARIKSHPLRLLFVDLAKSYDSVSRGGVYGPFWRLKAFLLNSLRSCANSTLVERPVKVCCHVVSPSTQDWAKGAAWRRRCSISSWPR